MILQYQTEKKLQYDRNNPNEIVIAFDPSGNFNEGRGTTGYAISTDGYIWCAGQVYAAEYETQMDYWHEILKKIDELDEKYPNKLTVVCEDYRLYASASEAQINSNLETPQLIGAIKYFCWERDIKIVMQMAAEVKGRWSNNVLENKGWLHYNGRQTLFGNLRVNGHSLDAVRHLMHYNTFKSKIRPKKESIKVERRNYSDY